MLDLRMVRSFAIAGRDVDDVGGAESGDLAVIGVGEDPMAIPSPASSIVGDGISICPLCFIIR